MAIETTSFAHIRLTVTDLARSRAFYERVFGWPVFAEVPDDADEPTRQSLAFLFGGVLYQVGDGLLGLRPVATDSFDEDRVGLDHLSFGVRSRADLETAAALLDEMGAVRGEIADLGVGEILPFRDPDNIALELFAPRT